MLFGAETWVDAILAAAVSRLQALVGLPAENVFDTLFSDEDHAAFPPADRFVTVRPVNFLVDVPGVTGGGRFNTGFKGSLRVALLSRVSSDQEFRSSRQLREAGRGLLPLQLKILSALQMFAPVNADGVCVLREPMRVRSWDVAFRTIRTPSPWAVLGSEWEVNFTSTLSHSAVVPVPS